MTVPRPAGAGTSLPLTGYSVLRNVIPPQPPPDVPPGWELLPPDFVGVGTMKSGTSWWWSILASHPDVASPRGSSSATGPPGSLNVRPYGSKEVHFFDHYGRVEDVDPVLYYRYFPRPSGSITGEWTPRYMYDFWTPPMLRMVAPNAKLLVLLRDPLERFISALAHHLKWGDDLDAISMDHQFRRGLYWQQIQALMTYFDRDQVLVLQYEWCVIDVAQEARRTFEFLGIDPDKWKLSQEWTRRVGPKHPKPILNQATRDALRRAYEPDLSRLLTEFPKLDGSLWPSSIGSYDSRSR